MAREKLTIEDAVIIWPNFSGVEGQYNAKGDRNFTIRIDPKLGEALLQDGWNIKFRDPRDEGDEPSATVQVSVNFTGRPPAVYMITERGRTLLDESVIGILDGADIVKADLMINPYEWSVNGKGGIKAYLDKMFVTVREDALDLKYADVPEAGQSPDFDG